MDLEAARTDCREAEAPRAQTRREERASRQRRAGDADLRRGSDSSLFCPSLLFSPLPAASLDTSARTRSQTQFSQVIGPVDTLERCLHLRCAPCRVIDEPCVLSGRARSAVCESGWAALAVMVQVRACRVHERVAPRSRSVPLEGVVMMIARIGARCSRPSVALPPRL